MVLGCLESGGLGIGSEIFKALDKYIYIQISHPLGTGQFLHLLQAAVQTFVLGGEDHPRTRTVSGLANHGFLVFVPLFPGVVVVTPSKWPNFMAFENGGPHPNH